MRRPSTDVARGQALGRKHDAHIHHIFLLVRWSREAHATVRPVGQDAVAADLDLDEHVVAIELDQVGILRRSDGGEDRKLKGDDCMGKGWGSNRGMG